MIWDFSERSTYHTTMVGKVKSYLTKICTKAEKETGLVPHRITDAWGYDKKSNTWYLCEVKVNYDDLQKSVYQITDTAFHFKKKRKKARVIPVILFPTRLY